MVEDNYRSKNRTETSAVMVAMVVTVAVAGSAPSETTAGQMTHVIATSRYYIDKVVRTKKGRRDGGMQTGNGMHVGRERISGP